jgi:molecular chaperone GrpE
MSRYPTSPDALADLVSGWRDAYVARLREIHELKQELRKYKEGTERESREFLLSVLNMLDRFDGTSRTIEAVLEPEDQKARKVLKSFQVLRKQLASALKRYGVLPMEVAPGEFVSGLHKVVATEPSESCPEGHILRVEKPGYYRNDSVLRSAEVVLSGTPDDAEETP